MMADSPRTRMRTPPPMDRNRRRLPRFPISTSSGGTIAVQEAARPPPLTPRPGFSRVVRSRRCRPLNPVQRSRAGVPARHGCRGGSGRGADAGPRSPGARIAGDPGPGGPGAASGSSRTMDPRASRRSGRVGRSTRPRTPSPRSTSRLRPPSRCPPRGCPVPCLRHHRSERESRRASSPASPART